MDSDERAPASCGTLNENQTQSSAQFSTADGMPSLRQVAKRRVECWMWFYFAMQLVYLGCNIGTTILLRRQPGWLVFFLVVILFDLFSQWRAGTVIFRLMKKQAPKKHSFERYLQGIPFTVTGFFIIFSTDLRVCMINIEQDQRAPLLILLIISSWLSVFFLAAAAVDIDRHASSEVVAKFEKIGFAAVSHVMFRVCELVMRLTAVAFVCILTNSVLSDFKWFDLTTAPPVAVVLTVFVDWLFHMMIFATASCRRDLPSDPFFALSLAAFVCVAMNPMFYLARPGYAAAASQLRTLNYFLQVAEFMLAVVLFTIVLSQVQLLRAPAVCQEHVMEADSIVRILFDSSSFWVMVAQFLIASTMFFAMSIFDGNKRRMLLRPGVETALPMLPFVSGTLASVQTRPEVGLTTFLVRLSGGGFLTRLVPQQPVLTSDFVVERFLGAGSFGVVVKVRQERENGMLLAEPRFYALKLANTDRPDKYINTLADPDELATRERDVYQKVWSTVNPVTGRNGHPFILRLECSCDWPDGVELFVEGTREPVESVDGRERNRTFHRALMLEFCPLGDLGGELSAHMRRGVDDSTPEKSLDWFQRAQRFLAEVLLALEYLHRQGIVYRDLKPENVLVVADEHERRHAKLGDFGFAKVLGPTEGSKSLAGSPYFSPPEMMSILKHGRQRELDGPAVDVFSFGTMLFCIFYGCDVLKRSRKGQQRCSVQEWERSRDDSQFKWRGPNELRIMPTGHSLSELAQQARCPQEACDVVSRSCRSNPTERCTLAAIKESGLFNAVTVAGLQLPRMPFEVLEQLQL